VSCRLVHKRLRTAYPRRSMYLFGNACRISVQDNRPIVPVGNHLDQPSHTNRDGQRYQKNTPQYTQRHHQWPAHSVRTLDAFYLSRPSAGRGQESPCFCGAGVMPSRFRIRPARRFGRVALPYQSMTNATRMACERRRPTTGIRRTATTFCRRVVHGQGRPVGRTNACHLGGE